MALAAILQQHVLGQPDGSCCRKSAQEPTAVLIDFWLEHCTKKQWSHYGLFTAFPLAFRPPAELTRVASSDFVTEKSRRLLYVKLNCSCWEQVSPFDIVESEKMRILQ